MDGWMLGKCCLFGVSDLFLTCFWPFPESSSTLKKISTGSQTRNNFREKVFKKGACEKWIRQKAGPRQNANFDRFREPTFCKHPIYIYIYICYTVTYIHSCCWVPRSNTIHVLLVADQQRGSLRKGLAEFVHQKCGGRGANWRSWVKDGLNHGHNRKWLGWVYQDGQIWTTRLFFSLKTRIKMIQNHCTPDLLKRKILTADTPSWTVAMC